MKPKDVDILVGEVPVVGGIRFELDGTRWPPGVHDDESLDRLTIRMILRPVSNHMDNCLTLFS